jgi:RNA polymerase sigma-70 factor (ECF subfamily)
MGDDEITRWAHAAGRGDAAATTAFIASTQADVWRYVAYLAGRDHADDLTQETYLRALRSLPGFRGETAALTWLMSIARRTAMDHFRARRRRPLIVDGAAESLDERGEPGNPDAAGEFALRALIERLEPDRRAAFVLTQLLGLSYAEAALACGVPIGTVRSRVARAREDLVGRLAAAEADEPPNALTRRSLTGRQGDQAPRRAAEVRG